MVIQCNPFVANPPPIFEIVGDPSPTPPLVDAPGLVTLAFRRRIQILLLTYLLTHRNIAITFGTEKLDWCGYPMVKNVEDTFIRFDMIHECDRHTAGQTPHDGTGRSYA